MIGKFRRSIVINLNFELDPRSFEFITGLNADVIGSLANIIPPLVTANKLTELRIEPTLFLPNDVMLGNSGGRDSFVSGDILQHCGFNVHRFKIDFDREQPTANYSTYEFNKDGNDHDENYEPFDIPLTYFAPLWDIRDRFPQHIAMGLSFDVLGFTSNQRKAPYESPTALRLHQQYLGALFGESLDFIFPIATLSTYSVFEYIRRRFSLKHLESLLSCWNNESGSDCGYCDKCQRIKLAASAMHLKEYEYLKGMPQVIDDHAYLLGNPLYNGLVKRYGLDALSESQLFSNGLLFNERIVEHIERTFSARYLTVDSNQSTEIQPVYFNGDTGRMSERLGIDYDEFPKKRMNDTNTRMPYEQYFRRDDVPVLAAHGEIPSYSHETGWSYKRVGEGPRLKVPNSLLFRRFFKQ